MPEHAQKHSSIQQFKQFIHSHPLLVKEVRNGEKTWQELYDEWLILGESHQQWLQYKREKKHAESNAEQTSSKAEQTTTSETDVNDTVASIMRFLKKYQLGDIQQHLAQFHHVLQNIQSIISNFQSTPTNKEQRNEFHDPFSFRRH